MINKINNSVAFRIFVVIAGVSIVLILSIVSVRTYMDYKNVAASAGEEIEQIWGSNRIALAESLWIMQGGYMQVQLEGILHYPHIEHVSIRKDNQVIASAGIIKSKEVIRRDYPLYHTYNNKPVYMGTVSIAAGLDGAYKNVFNNIFRRLFNDGLLVLIISLFILLTVYILLARHLATIAQHLLKMKAFDAAGPLVIHRTFSNKGEDELDQVVTAINTMSRNLQNTFHEMNREIEDRKQAERALQESEKRYRNLVEQTACLVTNVDKTGCFTYVNELGEKIFGKPIDALMGLSSFHFIHPHDRSKTETWFHACIGNHLPQSSIECRHINSSTGETFHMLWTANFIYGQDGQIAGVSGIAQDITDRKKSEEALSRIEKLEAIGTLAGGIAHDFNNLLGVMFGYLELSQMAAEETHQKEIAAYLAQARSAFNRAKDLTEQLLTFSKGGAPIRKIQSLAELVRQVVSFSLSGSNVAPEFDIPDDIGMCDLDEGQISRVIENVIINARHAMPQGGVLRVSLKNIPAADVPEMLPSKDHVRVSIQDHGTGIAQEHLPHIFDPFFTTKQMGSGLGLATSYSIIRQHDGLIDVETEWGRGTTFHVYLPASSGSMAAVAVDPPEGLQGKGRILIMDDEEMILEVLSLMLVNMGYEVIKTRHGKEATETVQEMIAAGKPLFAAILDLTIPRGLGGKEVVYTMLALDPKIKVIASSGYAHDAVMSNPGDYGFSGSLTKPYRKSDLTAVLGVAPPDFV